MHFPVLVIQILAIWILSHFLCQHCFVYRLGLCVYNIGLNVNPSWHVRDNMQTQTAEARCVWSNRIYRGWCTFRVQLAGNSQLGVHTTCWVILTDVYVLMSVITLPIPATALGQKIKTFCKVTAAALAQNALRSNVSRASQCFPGQLSWTQFLHTSSSKNIDSSRLQPLSQ